MGGRWRVLRTSTGRVWLRPAGSAGPKSVSEHATAPRIKASVNSVYNSSEIDKTRYCLPSRGTGGPTARAEPEVVFRGPITFNYLVLVLIRYIIVVKLIKSVIANPTDRKEGLRPVRSPKSFSEAPSPSTISFYVNSVYNSSEIDKTRYRPPDRWRDKNNFLVRLEWIWKKTPREKTTFPNAVDFPLENLTPLD